MNLAWMGWGIWTRTVKSFLQNRRVLFFSMKVFKSMKFSKVQMLKELSGGGRRDVETLNWLKHYWGLWKEGSVSWSFKGEVKFIQSIFCRKWLNFNFKHFLHFMTKIIGLQSIFGFSKKLFAVPTFQSGFLIFFRLEKLLNYNKLCFGFQKYIGVVFYRLQ